MMGERLFDAETGTVAGHNELGRLPDWDLSDLYAAPDAPELKRDMDWLEGACAGFAADYEGQLATLDAPPATAPPPPSARPPRAAAARRGAVRRYERIERVAGRIMSYAGLRYYQLTTEGERAKFMS